MNFGARFSEFAMTGAVFWICQILLFTVGTGEAAGAKFLDLLGNFIGTEDASSSALKSAAGSLLTIFGLIGIFITGLILDMIGSIFFMQEIRIFGGHISRNSDWLGRMTQKCSTAVTKDYQNFLSQFGDAKATKKHGYTHLLNLRFHYQRFKLRSSYRHMQTFLLSYIHVYSSNGTSDQLTDHVHVWRTSRAISTALFIVAIEVIVFESVAQNCESTTVIISGSTTLIIYGTLFALSAMLTLKSYNRMCFSLFTLACATNSHQLLSK